MQDRTKLPERVDGGTREDECVREDYDEARSPAR